MYAVSPLKMSCVVAVKPVTSGVNVPSAFTFMSLPVKGIHGAGAFGSVALSAKFTA